MQFGDCCYKPGIDCARLFMRGKLVRLFMRNNRVRVSSIEREITPKRHKTVSTERAQHTEITLPSSRAAVFVLPRAATWYRLCEAKQRTLPRAIDTRLNVMKLGIIFAFHCLVLNLH
jgi:hypothetical protein